MDALMNTTRQVNYRAIGEAIAKARRAAGMSEAQFAEKLGRSPASIHKMEAGRLTIYVDDFFNVARCLNVDPVKMMRDIEKVVATKKSSA